MPKCQGSVTDPTECDHEATSGYLIQYCCCLCINVKHSKIQKIANIPSEKIGVQFLLSCLKYGLLLRPLIPLHCKDLQEMAAASPPRVEVTLTAKRRQNEAV